MMPACCVSDAAHLAMLCNHSCLSAASVCPCHAADGAIARQPQRNRSLNFDILQVPEAYNGFCYVYEGSGKIGGTKASEQQALVMGKGAPSAVAACERVACGHAPLLHTAPDLSVPWS